MANSRRPRVTPDHPPLSRKEYLLSFSKELSAVASRVRQLIGGRHWLTDGTHKEQILGEMLHKHLPNRMRRARGFIVGSTEWDRCSREQDLLVIDTEVDTPLFDSGGTVIVHAASVRIAISVKSQLTTGSLVDSLDTLETAREVARREHFDPRTMLTVAFFFDAAPDFARKPTRVYNSLQRWHKANAPTPSAPAGADMICTSDNLLFNVEPNVDGEMVVRGYAVNGYGTAAFLTTIARHLKSLSVNPDALSILVGAAQDIPTVPLTPPCAVLAGAAKRGS